MNEEVLPTGLAGDAVVRSAPPMPIKDPAQDEKELDYSTLSVGAELEKRRIARIFYQEHDAIVYAPDNGGVRCEGRHFSAERDAAAAEMQRLSIRATTDLLDAYDDEVDLLLGRALAQVFLSPAPDPLKSFAAVERFIDDRAPVQKIFGRTSGWVVFTDKHGRTHCNYPEVPKEMMTVMTDFHRLCETGNLLGNAGGERNGFDQKSFDHLLGTELTVALRSGPTDTAFSSSREYLDRSLETHTRVGLIVSSLIVAIVSCVVVTAATWFFHPYMAGILGGVLGAMVSVLQRCSALKGGGFVSKQALGLEGAIRIGLGMIFGGILVALMESGQVFPLLQGKLAAIFVFGVIAGLNERFIPDLLTRTADAKTA